MSPDPDGPVAASDGPAGGAPGAVRPPVRTAPAARTALAGLAAAALGVGAGQALALLVAPAAGPVNAVADQVVALTPGGQRGDAGERTAVRPYFLLLFDKSLLSRPKS